MSLRIELLSLLSNDLQKIIHDLVGWWLNGNRKQKNMCYLRPKKWSRSLQIKCKYLFSRSFVQEFNVQYNVAYAWLISSFSYDFVWGV